MDERIKARGGGDSLKKDFQLLITILKKNF